MFGGLGVQELAIILVIALLIFGPRQLPRLGKSMADSSKAFRGAAKELHGDDDDEAA